MTGPEVTRLARECGFELAGVTSAAPNIDTRRYLDWAARGLGGRMGYLSDYRAGVRADPRQVLPTAQSMVVVGKLYNAPLPYSTQMSLEDRAWISRYAWGDDYHVILRRGLEELARRMSQIAPFEYRICVDTAPVLERSYARDAGLGWIGKNTCLINQWAGSWFFLGELLVSLEINSRQEPSADRCGSCTRCIDACPTRAIVPSPQGRYELDARLCISYFTIELKGEIPETHRTGMGTHVFGCDICQDVCPWNRRAAMTLDRAFYPREPAPPLELLAAITEQGFREMFAGSPVSRARYRGFLRNVAIAMGNSGNPGFHTALARLAAHEDPVVSSHAAWALDRLHTARVAR